MLLQAGAGTRAGVISDLILDGTIGSGEKGRAKVSGGGAVGAEVRAGRITGAGG